MFTCFFYKNWIRLVLFSCLVDNLIWLLCWDSNRPFLIIILIRPSFVADHTQLGILGQLTTNSPGMKSVGYYCYCVSCILSQETYGIKYDDFKKACTLFSHRYPNFLCFWVTSRFYSEYNKYLWDPFYASSSLVMV